MQLKWFFFIGFILNVFGLSTTGGKYLIPKNDSIVVKSLLKSLQEGSSIVDLFGNQGPVVIYELSAYLENKAVQTSNVLALLQSEVDTAVNDVNDAQDQKHVADTNFNEQSPPLVDALEVLKLAVAIANNNLMVAQDGLEDANADFDKESPTLNDELADFQLTITSLHSHLDSSYTLVCRQTVPKVFVKGETRVNADDSENANYAILDELESYRNIDGLFYFRLRWPQDTAETPVVYEWSQRSNPVNESIADYKAIKIPFTGQFWGGLEPSTAALMDGSVNHGRWFYAVGSFSLMNDAIPGYAKSDSDFSYHQQEVELSVWKKALSVQDKSLRRRTT